jgi:arylsulfatase A-like enzyme
MSRTAIAASFAIVFASAGTAAAGDPPRPNIALIMTDQQQAAMLGVAGTASLRTPAMDSLAAAGVRFERSFTACPQCSPARAALLTGRWPHRTGVLGNIPRDEPPADAGCSLPLDPGLPNLASVFGAAGYETAWFGKWHLGRDPSRYGFERSSGEPRDSETTRRAVEFLRGPRRRPFLLVASYVNPHDIYLARVAAIDAPANEAADLPASLADDLKGKPPAQRVFRDEDQGTDARGYGPASWQRYRRRYRSLIEEVDAEIGRALAALRAADPSALVVFTADHGELGGAHGLPYKGPMMYEELVRVPLVISWPGRIGPGVDRSLVSGVDLLPTLCDLAGIPAPPGIDGQSLARRLRSEDRSGKWPAGEVPSRDAVFAEYHGKQKWRIPIRMIRTDRWKYVRYRDGAEELYDLEADPGEMRNLAAAPAAAAAKPNLSARLDAWIARTADPFPSLQVTDRNGKATQPEEGR